MNFVRMAVALVPLGLLAQTISLPAPAPSRQTDAAIGQEQTAAAAPDSVTLEVAIAEALKGNLALIAQRYDIPVADAQIVTAGLRPNPVMSVEGEHLDILGTGYNTQNGAGPNEFAYRTDFPIERGGKRARRLAFAQASRSVAELGVLDAARNLVYAVQGAFIDVLLAKENVALARENLHALEDIVELNTTRVRTGDMAQVELLRSQVAALQYRNAVKEAELRLTQVRNTLQLLIGRQMPSPAFDVAGELRHDQGIVGREDLVSLAMRQRPDLEGLRQGEVRSDADARLQAALGKVDLSVGTEYRRQQGVNGTGNSLGFFLSAPLPVFHRNQGEITRARIERERAAARTRAAEAEIEAETENAYQQYLTARSLLVGIEQDMLTRAREVRATTEYSYQRGEASLVEFLDAQRAFNETMQGYNEARAGYARSLYLIDYVAGRTAKP